MNKKAPICSYPADAKPPKEKWKQEYLERLKACSNEKLFDNEYGEFWGDLNPDDYDGAFTGRGGWKAGEVENEIRRRLGVPEVKNTYV